MREASQDAGVFVAIVSAGVDLFVSSIASMLKVDDWIANGFVFDEEGFLTDEGSVASTQVERGPSSTVFWR